MVNRIIVTFVDTNKNEIIDLELPCNVIIADLKNQLKKVKELKIGDKNFRLVVNGNVLNENTSFSDNNIWDGTYITIETEGSVWR